ncbi:cell division protein ZapA [Thiomicrorhabdus sp. 6S2-11]|jgi:cell division protein ZapA (FtsZ GTPase activity inhibitor)|uniref:Cell division protein ZapA n=1 Tax=Thiomicrorhabdus marina TaxID=2818442 RepID=A0ABS3Q2N4_9GAMM|nr:cell division protein ZapA [Thiomicrorhabdus marina]MBO1926080.1 cell division protein ZapA [Thiomicrorhabdus marina]
MIEINTMGHRFKFQCEDDERKRLEAAAEMIEQKMLELPKANRNERSLLMVAINIAYDFIQLKEEAHHNSEDMKSKIDAIHTILTSAIEAQSHSEESKTSVN